MCLSWHLNFVRIGALILFLHDFGDVFTYGIKVLVDTDCTAATGLAFLLVIGSWGYSRLYILPTELIRAVAVISPAYIGDAAAAGFTVLLVLLLCLHVYWYGLILNMGRQAVSGGGSGKKAGWNPSDSYQRKNKDKAN